MPLPASRSVVIMSGLLTLLVLSGGTLAVALHNGWLRTATADVPGRETLTASAQPTVTGNDRDVVARLTERLPAPPTQGAGQDEVGVYRQKLEEAYRALDDTYAQVRSLQSAQPELASARYDDDEREHDGDDHRRGRRSDGRRSHDD